MPHKDFSHIDSIYWVFTQLCNDECAHCYNQSGPAGSRITSEECMAIIENLPASVGRIILSGGEPLADRKLLYQILEKLGEKYGQQTRLMLQTNGDLLSTDILRELLALGVTRFDIASIDRFHKARGSRLAEIAEIFESEDVALALSWDDEENEDVIPVTWGHWGSTDDMWLGGNWARGRAMQNNLWKQDGKHNFCALHSGALGFLTGTEDEAQEITIQLWKVHPCCPGTKFPIGDARSEKVADILERIAVSPVFEKLNQGDPYRMGESINVSENFARSRADELKNVCRWCDEFFTKYYNIQKLQPK